MQQLREIEHRLQDQPDKQLSLTDPDARSMATSGRGTGMVGYNVQMAADTKHHLIVAHDVINVGSDRGELWSMATKAREGVGKDKLEVIADRGYFKGPEILACEEAGIKTYVPKPMTSNAKAEGRFSKADFIYIARDDEYQCPAGERLRRHQTSVENGMKIDTYWTYICPHCPHNRQRTARASLGARGGAGDHATALGPQAGRNESAAAHDRACLRNAEALDGFGALPHENTPARQYRSELARPCI